MKQTAKMEHTVPELKILLAGVEAAQVENLIGRSWRELAEQLRAKLQAELDRLTKE